MDRHSARCSERENKLREKGTTIIRGRARKEKQRGGREYWPTAQLFGSRLSSDINGNCQSG